MARLTASHARCLVSATFATAMLSAGGKTATPAMAPVAATPSAPAPQVDDVDVATNVSTAQRSGGVLKGFKLQALVTKGDVRLIGTVDTQEQVDSAKAIARAAPGVHSIHDELVIKR